jgi:iron complex outermembrane receptor protein
MHNFSHSIGLSFRPFHHLTLYSNYSTSFQTPTTTELSNNPSGIGGFNKELKPENTSAFEAGIRGIFKVCNLFYNLSLYHYNVKDMLIPYQIGSINSDEVFYRNAGEAINDGIDLLLIWQLLTNLSSKLSYSHMNFRFSNYNVEVLNNDILEYFQLGGKKIPGISPDVLALGVNYQHPAGLTLDFSLTWNGSYFTNDFNGPPIGSNENFNNFINESFLTADFKLNYNVNIGHFIANSFFGVNNLFNRKYYGSIVPNAIGNRYFEPSSMRNWYFGLKFIIE